MKHFSVTELNLFLRCPFAWHVQYRLRIKQKKTDALFYGIGVHSMLEAYHSNTDPVMALERFFTEDTSIPTSFEKQAYKQKAINLLEIYKKDAPYIEKVISLEERKTVPLTHPKTKKALHIPFTFKMDMICEILGKRYVVDWKTMKGGGNTQDDSNRRQGILYCMAHRELFGTRPDGFMQIGLVGTKIPKVIPLQFHYTIEEEIQVWNMAKTVLDIIEKEKELETPPMMPSFYPCPARSLGCMWHNSPVDGDIGF